ILNGILRQGNELCRTWNSAEARCSRTTPCLRKRTRSTLIPQRRWELVFSETPGTGPLNYVICIFPTQVWNGAIPGSTRCRCVWPLGSSSAGAAEAENAKSIRYSMKLQFYFMGINLAEREGFYLSLSPIIRKASVYAGFVAFKPNSDQDLKLGLFRQSRILPSFLE